MPERPPVRRDAATDALALRHCEAVRAPKPSDASEAGPSVLGWPGRGVLSNTKRCNAVVMQRRANRTAQPSRRSMACCSCRSAHRAKASGAEGPHRSMPRCAAQQCAQLVSSARQGIRVRHSSGQCSAVRCGAVATPDGIGAKQCAQVGGPLCRWSRGKLSMRSTCR